MVVGDHTGAYDSIGGQTAIPLRASSGLDEHDDAVFDIGARAALTVGKVTLRDWNLETPSLDMDVSEKGPSDAGPEWYDYPGEYEEPSRGQTLARLMSEAYACAAAKNQGTTSCGRFAPGRTFDLTNTQTAGPRGGLVVLSVSHDWKVDETGFRSPFEALASDVTYRAPREHEEPVLTNPMTGIVTGPVGEDIHTDEYGRVKVQFHWDREFPEDDTCSHWIPVMQDNTGHSVGIPRIGWEVLVHFLEGDPDRPVVMGRVYNGADTMPRLLPRDKTWSSLRSLSSPTRDGENTIQFRDPTGEERIWVHAERDQNVNVANDKDQKVLVDESAMVAHDEKVQIGGNHTAKIAEDVTPEVRNNQSWSVGGNSDRKITGVDRDEISKDRSLTIDGNYVRTVATDTSMSVEGNYFEMVSGAVVETSNEGSQIEAGQDLRLTVAGSLVETAKGDKQESVGKQRKETVTGDVSWTAEGAIQVQASDKRITSVQGSLNVHAADDIAITGAKKCSVLSITAAHKGSQSITMKVGDTVVVMQEGMIKIVASDKITMKTTAQNNQGAGKSTQI
jgi:type VI secretion system secreted protein VgrG